MSQLGFRTVNEMVGRVDKLDSRQVIEHWKARGLDLSRLLHRPEAADRSATYCREAQDHSLDKALDNKLIELAQDALSGNGTVSHRLPIRNSNRTVGAMLSGEVAKRYGDDGLPEDSIRFHFEGSAGQSFGAFLSKGVSLELAGDANDYTGKGMSGGRIVVYPPEGSTFVPEENVITGNAVLYGATGGMAFFRGVAGERFAVRNSGACTVVEGVGDHGSEYMTGGIVVVLGRTRRNFAAGMTGGIAYVLDRQGDFNTRCNRESVDLEPVSDVSDQMVLRRMIEWHLKYTDSANAREILDTWEETLPKFIKVMPEAYREVLKAQNRAQPREMELVLNG
jgi:glutamate synthase domain-containing protein 3